MSGSKIDGVVISFDIQRGVPVSFRSPAPIRYEKNISRPLWLAISVSRRVSNPATYFCEMIERVYSSRLLLPLTVDFWIIPHVGK